MTHVREFTDNSAAEYVSERGKPSTLEMQALCTFQYETTLALGVFVATTRVASVDNDIADGLSRGGKKLQDALRMMAESRLPVVRLRIDPEADDVANIISRLL